MLWNKTTNNGTYVHNNQVYKASSSFDLPWIQSHVHFTWAFCLLTTFLSFTNNQSKTVCLLGERTTFLPIQSKPNEKDMTQRENIISSFLLSWLDHFSPLFTVKERKVSKWKGKWWKLRTWEKYSPYLHHFIFFYYYYCISHSCTCT